MTKERKYSVLSLAFGICLIAPHSLWGDIETASPSEEIWGTIWVFQGDPIDKLVEGPVQIQPILLSNTCIDNNGGELTISINPPDGSLKMRNFRSSAIVGTNKGMTVIKNNAPIFSNIEGGYASSDGGVIQATNGASIDIEKTKINIEDKAISSQGVAAASGGIIRLLNCPMSLKGVNVYGLNARGLYTNATPSAITYESADIHVESSTIGIGATSASGAYVSLNNSTINLVAKDSFNQSYGLSARGIDNNGNPSTIICQGTHIQSSEDPINTVYGAAAEIGGCVQLSTTSIDLQGNNFYGLYARGKGNASTPSTIDFQADSITLNGNAGIGAFAGNGGKIQLGQSDIQVNSSGGGAGAAAKSGGNLNLTSSSIWMSGQTDNCYGLVASGVEDNKPSTMTCTDIHVAIKDQSSNTAHGAFAEDGGNIQLSTASIDLSGHYFYGLYAKGMDNDSTPSIINFQGTSISLNGGAGTGVCASHGGVVNLMGEIESSSPKSVFNMMVNGLEPSDSSYGLYADSKGSIEMSNMDMIIGAPLSLGMEAIDRGSSITLNSVNMHFSQPNATGVRLSHSSSINLNASTIKGPQTLSKRGHEQRALRLSEEAIYPAIYSGTTLENERNSFKMTDGLVEGDFTHLIYADHSQLEASFERSSVISPHLKTPLCHATKDSLVNIYASDNASLTGDLEGEGNIHISLLNDTSWKGKRSEELKPIVQLEIHQNSLWEVTGSSSIDLVNHQRGTIEMAPITDAGATLLEIEEYQGMGGNVILNTALGFNNSASDLMTVNHYTATNPTTLTLRNQGAPQGMVLSHTIPLIKVAKSESLDEGAFVLDEFMNAEGYNYTFQYDPHDPFWHIWSLQLEENTDHTSLYAALPSNALSYNLSLIDTFHERMGALPREESSTLWSRYSYQKGDAHQTYHGTAIQKGRSSYTNQTFQVGATLLSKRHQNGHQDDVGVYGALGEAASHILPEGAPSGKNKMVIQSAATYWTHFGPSREYLDAVIQGSYYRTQSAALKSQAKTTGFSMTGSLEGGIPFQMNLGFFIEPEVQMISQLMHLHSFSEGNSRVKLKNISSFVTRLGVRVGKDWPLSEKPISIWARGSSYHEWLGGSEAIFDPQGSSTPFSLKQPKSWGEFNVGVDAVLREALSLYGSTGYTTDFSLSHAYDVEVGLTWRW
ncbi:autotransporter outer membrane beta-barrel domain-containing protein [Rhabdochlamydiaceae symbiont of Dictyostelium giganteum]|uniref:autotransporter outer membrane beta-barrel domain-containing protein n=1 Tax=Rhabdochlamydiaceae symbiont of Dictyostelium giganteum TaxID=3342349 RepID=UPI00384E13D9